MGRIGFIGGIISRAGFVVSKVKIRVLMVLVWWCRLDVTYCLGIFLYL